MADPGFQAPQVPFVFNKWPHRLWRWYFRNVFERADSPLMASAACAPLTVVLCAVRLLPLQVKTKYSEIEIVNRQGNVFRKSVSWMEEVVLRTKERRIWKTLSSMDGSQHPWAVSCKLSLCWSSSKAVITSLLHWLCSISYATETLDAGKIVQTLLRGRYKSWNILYANFSNFLSLSWENLELLYNSLGHPPVHISDKPPVKQQKAS